MDNEQEQGAEAKAPAKAEKKAEAKAEPKFEGNVDAYLLNPENWEILNRVAKQYGFEFLGHEKRIHRNTIPVAQTRQIVTICEAYRSGKLR